MMACLSCQRMSIDIGRTWNRHKKDENEDMALVLGSHHDFKYEKTAVEHLLEGHGFPCFFIPKFHCELNPIERVWGAAKRYTREHCDYSFAGLENTVNPALDSVGVDLIRKYFRRVREYVHAGLQTKEYRWTRSRSCC